MFYPVRGNRARGSRSGLDPFLEAMERHGISGILIHGHNHFLVSGPCPVRVEALAIAQNWSVIHGDRRWAIVTPGDNDMSPAFAELLDELRARGIEIQEV